MNIILIGMPGCGKSTAGVVLAKKLGYGFVDADLVIQAQRGMLLQQIIDAKGDEALLEAEDIALKSIICDRTVIATGGSAVFSKGGMAHLKQKGVAVYIDLPLDCLAERLSNLDTRGVAGAANMTLAQIFEQRTPLYKEWADITVDAQNLTITQVADKIIEQIKVAGLAKA